MIKQDTLGNQAKLVYIALGSNLGNKKNNLEKAKFLLQNNGIKIELSSSIYETKSWPNKNFPNYFNVVLKTKTFFKPKELLMKIKEIEVLLGRNSFVKNYPRTCDIDIIDFDQKIININTLKHKLTIPHSKLHERSFVLLPLFEISKNWTHPITNKKICDLLLDLGVNNLRSIKHL